MLIIGDVVRADHLRRHQNDYNAAFFNNADRPTVRADRDTCSGDAPAFFSVHRLGAVTTQYWPLGGSAFANTRAFNLGRP